MAVNKPVGDNARKGAVKKRSQVKTKLGGATAWTKRSKDSGDEAYDQPGEYVHTRAPEKVKPAEQVRPRL